MGDATPPSFTAFEGPVRVASGSMLEVALAARERTDADGNTSVLIFQDATGRSIDLDLRGSDEEVRDRFTEAEPEEVTVEAPRKRGRPKLGVVSKEVTLLPRQWAWLAAQRGGISATLRRLVEDARKAGELKERIRVAQDAAYRFMSAMAGDLAGFEEAIRALYARDRGRLEEHMEAWPPDVRDHALYLAADAFPAPAAAQTDQGDA
jgi:hypothetical protein